jgi:hypothetical protein
MPRYTISHHTSGPEADHFDLFLQLDDTLKSWRLERTMFDIPQPAVRTEDHRTAYLDLEGPVSKNRGQVKIWDTGDYAADVWTDQRIVVAVRGRKLKARLRLDRPKPETPDAWVVADASIEVRKLATAMLRDSALDAAPDAALEDVQAALSTEEREILALVDAYAKGAPIAWEKVVVDGKLRERLSAERARWRHPWLDAATSHAERLGAIAKSLVAGRP